MLCNLVQCGIRPMENMFPYVCFCAISNATIVLVPNLKIRKILASANCGHFREYHHYREQQRQQASFRSSFTLSLLLTANKYVQIGPGQLLNLNSNHYFSTKHNYYVIITGRNAMHEKIKNTCQTRLAMNLVMYESFDKIVFIYPDRIEKCENF